MPLYIGSDEVKALAERLAVQKRVNKTEAVKIALENELRRVSEPLPLWERLKPLLDHIAACPDSSLVADKTFFDELSGES